VTRFARLAAWIVILAAALSGCDFGFRLSGSPARGAGRVGPPRAGASTAAAAGVGDKPVLGAPKPFEPKAPEIFQGPNGLTVWLVERPALPLVSATFVVPYGAASDPQGRPGTMSLVADMLDEGAGKRSALVLSETIASLGASLGTHATADGSFAAASSLRQSFDTTFEILCDVVARPRFETKEFARVKKLWKNALKKRADDPSSVANVVTASVLYDQDTPYGHPVAGLYAKADYVDLGMLKSAYERAWRPDRATLVVVGQITRKELEAKLTEHLGAWKPKGDPLPPPKLTGVLAARPRVVLVDRPKAVQTVIMVSREGVAASDERASALSLVNTALGGSFTSRLNLNLREAKNWTYGVGSSFVGARGQGSFYVKTEVEVDKTGPSIKEIMGELGAMADKGLVADELEKVKALDRAELIEQFETVSGTASRLGQLVALGLPAGYDAASSRLRQGATLDELARLAKAHMDPAGFTIVLVGDRDKVVPQLGDVGLTDPVFYSVEGQPLPQNAAKKDAPPAPKQAKD
jgi:predicted Zn-dependent peptidase